MDALVRNPGAKHTEGVKGGGEERMEKSESPKAALFGWESGAAEGANKVAGSPPPPHTTPREKARESRAAQFVTFTP